MFNIISYKSLLEAYYIDLKDFQSRKIYCNYGGFETRILDEFLLKCEKPTIVLNPKSMIMMGESINKDYPSVPLHALFGLSSIEVMKVAIDTFRKIDLEKNEYNLYGQKIPMVIDKNEEVNNETKVFIVDGDESVPKYVYVLY